MTDRLLPAYGGEQETIVCIKTRAAVTETNALLALWAHVTRPVIIDRELDRLHETITRLVLLKRAGQ